LFPLYPRCQSAGEKQSPSSNKIRFLPTSSFLLLVAQNARPATKGALQVRRGTQAALFFDAPALSTVFEFSLLSAREGPVAESRYTRTVSLCRFGCCFSEC